MAQSPSRPARTTFVPEEMVPASDAWVGELLMAEGGGTPTDAFQNDMAALAAAPADPQAATPTPNAISLTAAGTAYTQDFNSLATTGTTNALTIQGFTITETGGSARDNELYGADTGASGTGDTYSYGAAGSAERALGGLQSGTLIPTISAEFANNTGAAIKSLAISYTGEQWRVGTVNRADRLDFQYSLDGVNFIDVDQLDFNAPTSATTGAKDGNAAANRVAVSFTIAGLDIPAGQAFFIRYNSFEAAGADDGLAIDDFSLTANPGATPPPPPPAGPGAFSINDASVVEGDAGTTPIVFTVTRPAGSTGAASVDYAVLFAAPASGQADAADLSGPTTGTLTFADGVTSQTITLAVVGDMVVEPSEAFTVVLSGATGGATIADGMGAGTIANDDFAITRIFDIQGAQHRSPLVGQTVSTTGIVTAVDSNGFYLQDATGDGNVATSDALFIFTSTVPTVAVGQNVSLTGTVTEFIPGGAASNNLSTTQLQTITDLVVNSSANALPAAIVLGAGGRLPPTEIIEDDNFTSFDPATDGIDFYESLEGMLVRVPAPIVVAPTTDGGEIFTITRNDAGQPHATNLSARGTLNIDGATGGAVGTTNQGTGFDFNPERIQIDADATLTPGGNVVPLVDVGALLNDVTGIVTYNFGIYEVAPTTGITVQTASTLAREVTTLAGTAGRISIASYNVENLDPSDGARFGVLARQIGTNLGRPDIIGLQEIQDNNGATNDAVTAANVTLQMLVDAIFTETGVRYAFIDNPFIADDRNGGEPGGNIRTAFLYRTDRVSLIEGSVATTLNADELAAQRTDRDSPFFASRVPLVATFGFAGQQVTVVDNHFAAKGGSSPLFGAIQPSTNADEAQRQAQARNVADYVARLGPTANVVVLGDLNEFETEEALIPLSTTGGLTYLINNLPEEERYSFIFEGNSQQLDHVYVSGSLRPGAQVDIVHVNTEFTDRPTDHDPSVVTLILPARATGTDGNDTFTGTAGNDIFAGGAGNDFFALQQGGDDRADGGAGDDAFYFGPALTAADVVDGGAGGNDQLGIQGDYTGARAVTLSAITNVEVLLLLTGNDTRFGDVSNSLYGYDVTTNDGNVAAGGTLTVDANRLRPGENVVFNGSAETDGSFFVFGGQGVDRYVGGAGNDVFLFREERGFTADDRIDGGAGGLDQLGLQGNYTGANAVTFGAATLVNVEGIVALSGRDTRFGRDTGLNNSFNLTLNDANVAAGQLFTVDAGSLRPLETLTFDGSAETNGTFRIFGGDGADVITGGRGNDSIRGGLGNDVVNHNATTSGADAVDLGAGTDVVRVNGGGATQIRLTFTSAEVGNGNGNRAADGRGNVSLQSEDVDGTLFGGPVSRFDDEGIVFTAVGNERFDVRDTGGAERGDQFEVVVLGTAAGETLDSVQFTRSYYINAGAGDDVLNGGLLRDFLVGGAGNDRMTGGFNGDRYLGGGGNDVFVIENAGDSFGREADTILDFTKGSDLIDLSGIDANTAAAGDDAFRFIGSAAFGNMAGELRSATDANGRMFVEGDIDGDSVADFTLFVVTVPAGQPLVATDFIL